MYTYISAPQHHPNAHPNRYTNEEKGMRIRVQRVRNHKVTCPGAPIMPEVGNLTHTSRIEVLLSYRLVEYPDCYD